MKKWNKSVCLSAIAAGVFLTGCGQQEVTRIKSAAQPAKSVAAQPVTAPGSTPAMPAAPEAAVPPISPPKPEKQFIEPVISFAEVPPPPLDIDLPVNRTAPDGSYDVVPAAMPVERKPMQDEPLSYVDEAAEFPGGQSAMKQFISEHLVYPPSAREAGIEGKCYLKFVVSKSGEISDVRIMRGVAGCKECGDEAVRVVRSMPKWNPGKNGGKPVDSYFSLPVAFVL